jgi:hypothetical protein
MRSSEVQNETLDVIRALVGEGLFTLGAVGEKGEQLARSLEEKDIEGYRGRG